MAPENGSLMQQMPVVAGRLSAPAAVLATTTTTVPSDSDKQRSMSVSFLPELVPARVMGPKIRGKPARKLLNPWRELDRDAFVIAYAMKGTARCGACLSKVAKGEVQLGTFYMHEDKFTLVRWYHQRCVVAPECLTHPMDLCGIEDLKGDDLDRVMKWLGFGPTGSAKDRSWTA